MTSIFSAMASGVLAVTNTSARLILPKTAIIDLSGNNPPTLWGVNVVEILCATGTLAADDLVYVTFGDAAVVATVGNGSVMRPNVKTYHQLQPGDTHIAAISSANGANLAFAIGSMR